jgi:hypothetical protein
MLPENSLSRQRERGEPVPRYRCPLCEHWRFGYKGVCFICSDTGTPNEYRTSDPTGAYAGAKRVEELQR